MDFFRSVYSYFNNFTTALSFALLLFFVLPFSWLSNGFVSSSTLMIGYGFLRQPLLESIILLVVVLAFLFFYSVLVCLMVLSVRRDLSRVKTQHYLSEKIHKFAMKYFKVLAVFTIVAALLSSILVDFGVSVPVISLFMLVVSASLLFLPQTIVVDEEGLEASLLSNWEFILKNPGTFAFVTVFGIASVLILEAVEFLIDYFLFAGNFLSLFLALVFLVPFLEAVKTQIYMERFSLIEGYQRNSFRRN